jgi:hypothetical protein
MIARSLNCIQALAAQKAKFARDAMRDGDDELAVMMQEFAAHHYARARAIYKLRGDAFKFYPDNWHPDSGE